MAEIGNTPAGNTSRDPALTWRAILVSLCMVLVWTAGCIFAVCFTAGYQQHLLMILGFGAILTVFLLQVPRLFLATILLVWIGSTAFAMHMATPDEYPRLLKGFLLCSVVVVPLSAMAVWLAIRPLKRGELVIVYSAVVVAIPWAICLKAVIESSTANLIDVQRLGEPQMYAWAKEMPWWGPTVPTGPQSPPSAESLAAAEGFARGNGGHVPWALWWRPLLYWSGICSAWAAMLMGILLLFRKRWVEHERLPFVWALPALALIRGQTQGPLDPNSDAAPAIDRRRWIVFLIGLSICLPAIFFVSPTGEPLTTWTCLPWAGQTGILAGIDLTDLNIIPGVDLRLVWCPLVLLALLFFPVDVLLTTALAYILLKIALPGLMNSMGFATAQAHLNAFVRLGLQIGGAIGLVLWSVWFNRLTIWGYIRSLWGGEPTDQESHDELGRKKIILMIILGFVIFVAMGSYAAHPYWYPSRPDGSSGFSVPVPVQMIVLTLMVVIYTISQVRMRAEGLPTTYDNNYPSHQLVGLQRDLWNDHYTLASKGVSVTGTSWSAQWFQWGFCGQLKSLGPHNVLLETFKVASETGVHPRAVAKTILATLILVGILTPLIYVQLIYAYGYENSYQGLLSFGYNYTQWSERAVSYGMYSTSRVLWFPAAGFYDRHLTTFNIFYGIMVVGLLFHLRREYPRFPISPVGVVIAAQMHAGRAVFSTELIWFSFLVAGIVKALIFRWMGVRSFREKIQPAIVLMLCGVIYGIMLFLFRYVSLGHGFLK